MYEIINLDELIRRLEKYSHKELHVHHTWRPNHAQYYGTKHTDEDKRAIDRQKAMRDFHVNTNGWTDIGQHVTLLPDGRFVTGRPFDKTPASISGHNTGAFAVEMIGDFDKGKDKLEGRQKESIIGLARYFDSKGRYVRFHRENSTKTCPGSGIDKAEFMAEVRRDNVLKKGDKGDVVKFFQQMILDAGYKMINNGKEYGADGSYGTATLNGVKLVQKDAGLPQTGELDIQTVMALINKAKSDDLTKLKAENANIKIQVQKFQDFFKQLKTFLQ